MIRGTKTFKQLANELGVDAISVGPCITKKTGKLTWGLVAVTMQDGDMAEHRIGGISKSITEGIEVDDDNTLEVLSRAKGAQILCTVDDEGREGFVLSHNGFDVVRNK